MKPIRYVQIHQIVSEEKLQSVFFTMKDELRECLEKAVREKKIEKVSFYSKEGMVLQTFYVEIGIEVYKTKIL